MKKELLFKPNQLPKEEAKRDAAVLSFSDAQLARMSEEERKEAEKVPERKKRRFEKLIPDGHLALARIELVRLPPPKDAPPGTAGAIKVNEYKGRKSVTVKLVMTGRYSNRWIFEQIVFSVEDKTNEEDMNDLYRGKAFIRDVFANEGIDIEPRVSAMDKKLVPVVVGSGHRYGKKSEPVVNRAWVLSPHPSHSLYEEYYTLAKRIGEKIPGWRFYPSAPAATLIEKRKDTKAERAEKSRKRLLKKFGAE